LITLEGIVERTYSTTESFWSLQSIYVAPNGSGIAGHKSDFSFGVLLILYFLKRLALLLLWWPRMTCAAGWRRF